MIDGRETPRRAVPGDLGEPSEPPPRRRSRLAIAAPVARRMASTRVGIAVGSLIVLTLVLALVGSRMVTAALQWIHHQSIYQQKFTGIELDPPCPKWIKSGSIGLLEQVRKAAKRPESFSVPDQDLDEIATDFKHSPWVSLVERVEASTPNRLRVQLLYREPVARVVSTGAFVDAKNVVLPAGDIELNETGILLFIKDKKRTAADNQPPATLVAGQEHPGFNLRNAALLAGFLKQQMMLLEVRETPARPVIIYSESLYIETADHSFLFWGDPPGGEKPGDLTAAEKWAIFARWATSPNRVAIPHPRRMVFTKTGLIIKDDDKATR